ncbi:MAG: hypothetical protein ACRD2L_00650, partial [Terriglobia bacterium]
MKKRFTRADFVILRKAGRESGKRKGGLSAIGDMFRDGTCATPLRTFSLVLLVILQLAMPAAPLMAQEPLTANGADKPVQSARQDQLSS